MTKENKLIYWLCQIIVFIGGFVTYHYGRFASIVNGHTSEASLAGLLACLIWLLVVVIASHIGNCKPADIAGLITAAPTVFCIIGVLAVMDKSSWWVIRLASSLAMLPMAGLILWVLRKTWKELSGCDTEPCYNWQNRAFALLSMTAVVIIVVGNFMLF